MWYVLGFFICFFAKNNNNVNAKFVVLIFTISNFVSLNANFLVLIS